jgi:hypothetical protein
MTIILSTTNTQPKNQKQSKKKSKAQTKQQALFDKLWQRIERKKKQNQKLRTELDALSLVYKQRLMPLEIAAKTPVFLLLEKLIDFYSRKSMTKWQRVELTEWISESMEIAFALDSEKTEALKEQWLIQIADFHEIDRDEMKETIKAAEADPEAFFEGKMNDEFGQKPEDFESPDSADDNTENSTYDMFGDAFDDEQTDQDDDDPFKAFREAFEEFKAEMESRQAPEPLKMDEKWLKSVFRKTANALHPDKEQDIEKREEKEALMTELLRARDENDVLGLINLYHAHVSEDALEINEKSLDALCAQLQNQLDRLRYEKEDLISGVENPIHEMVYTNLYGQSKQQQEKIINDYSNELSQDKQDQINLIASLKNLKVLKVHLEDRYDSKRYSPFL